MTICDDLRQSVLQAAIQGKLTQQLPEDGSAADLLASIKAEKEQLIKEKKIKKEKPLPPIRDEEIPFDIPDNWDIVRLGELISIKSGDSLTSKEFIPGNIPVYGGNGITGYHNASNVEKGTILIGRVGFYCGCIHITESDAWATDNALIVRYDKCFDQRYLVLLLKALDLGHSTNQTAQPVVTGKIIRPIIAPIPPLAEQHRIVARVEELMAKIDELEKVENELNALHKAFPGDMKAALLQAAMQGKLTEQLPEDGNAEDLLKSIEAEKAKLIAEKKIKKQKALELISEEDAPLQIPSNWSWAYIGDIFSHNAGKALNAKNQVGNKHKYITTSNVYWDHFELDNLKEMYYTDEEVEKYSVKKGDLLVLEGGDIGRSAIWNLDVSYCIQNHLHCLRPYLASSTNVKYYYYLMMLYKQIGAVNGKGIAIQGLSANALHGIAVPVAPLAEQQRIVERLDKLLPLCDSLEEKL